MILTSQKFAWNFFVIFFSFFFFAKKKASRLWKLIHSVPGEKVWGKRIWEGLKKTNSSNGNNWNILISSVYLSFWLIVVHFICLPFILTVGNIAVHVQIMTGFLAFFACWPDFSFGTLGYVWWEKEKLKNVMKELSLMTYVTYVTYVTIQPITNDDVPFYELVQSLLVHSQSPLMHVHWLHCTCLFEPGAYGLSLW